MSLSIVRGQEKRNKKTRVEQVGFGRVLTLLPECSQSNLARMRALRKLTGGAQNNCHFCL